MVSGYGPRMTSPTQRVLRAMFAAPSVIVDARAFNSAARGALDPRRTLVDAVCTTDDAAARRTGR